MTRIVDSKSAIVYETYFETTSQLINKSIAIVVPFEWNAQSTYCIYFLQKIIHFYINLLYVLILFLLVFFY